MLVSFVAATLLTLGLNWVLVQLGVMALLSSTIVDTLVTVVLYALTLLIVIGVPYWARQIRTSYEELGLTRWPSWMDLLLAPAGFIVYLILSWLLGAIADAILPWYDLTEAQSVGFEGITLQYEFLLAFVCLVVLAPVAEELLFRGYLFGKLMKHVPVWAAALVTSVLFGLVHGSWTVGVDVFALSLVLCSLRVMTGSIWSSTVLHMIKNGLAFYFLFINPLILPTMGG